MPSSITPASSVCVAHQLSLGTCSQHRDQNIAAVPPRHLQVTCWSTVHRVCCVPLWMKGKTQLAPLWVWHPTEKNRMLHLTYTLLLSRHVLAQPGRQSARTSVVLSSEAARHHSLRVSASSTHSSRVTLPWLKGRWQGVPRVVRQPGHAAAQLPHAPSGTWLVVLVFVAHQSTPWLEWEVHARYTRPAHLKGNTQSCPALGPDTVLQPGTRETHTLNTTSSALQF